MAAPPPQPAESGPAVKFCVTTETKRPLSGEEGLEIGVIIVPRITYFLKLAKYKRVLLPG